MLIRALALTLLASPVWADSQGFPLGSTPDAGQLGHVFFSVCHPTKPALLGDRIALAETAFGWVATDLGTDAAFQTPDGQISVTLDGNVLAATCEMTIPTAIGGDGADLYDGLVAHLTDDNDGTEPPADFTDGGVVWSWDAYTLTFIEHADGFTIALTSES